MPQLTQPPQERPDPQNKHPGTITSHQIVILMPHCTSNPPSQRPTTPPLPPTPPPNTYNPHALMPTSLPSHQPTSVPFNRFTYLSDTYSTPYQPASPCFPPLSAFTGAGGDLVARQVRWVMHESKGCPSDRGEMQLACSALRGSFFSRSLTQFLVGG